MFRNDKRKRHYNNDLTTDTKINNIEEGVEQQVSVELTTLMSLPVHLRVSILNFLGKQTQDDLTNLTLVSKQMHKNCNRPGIEWKITPTIVISASKQECEFPDRRTRILIKNLAHNKKLDRYSHMRINDIHKFDYIYEGELKRITKDVQLEGIVSLDGSFTLVASFIRYESNETVWLFWKTTTFARRK